MGERWIGIGIAALGLLCLGGGLVLLAWRVLAPDEAVLLPPGVVSTPEPTLTPGVLRATVAPPPRSDDPAQVVILPVSEQSSPTPTGSVLLPTAAPVLTLTPTATVSPTRTPSPMPTATRTASSTAPLIAQPTAPSTVQPTVTHTFTSTATLSPTRTLTHTPTFTATPTATPAVPDRIVINTIGLDAPIVPVGQHPVQIGEQVYSQWDVPDVFAAGWHQSSAPLGQPGNTVLNGHHNVYGEVFRYLEALEPGDVVVLESGGERFFYMVAQTMTLPEQDQPIEVRRENARWILPTGDERVTLITCWPYRANAYRLVVIALPVAVLAVPEELP